jgi:uncharacterized LabA/DUF88 family protein
MEKVAIFVDVQNIYYTCKHTYQRHFNYRAFWDKATKNRNVVYACAYAIEKGDMKQQGFQQILRSIGFEVKLKPYIQRCDGSAKGDWDIGITLDVIDYANKVDVVILLSGDGDFAVLLTKLRNSFAVTTEVYGVPALTATMLIQSSNAFFAIDNLLLL